MHKWGPENRDGKGVGRDQKKIFGGIIMSEKFQI